MSAADNLNDRIAIKITDSVSTMWCAYIFCIIALISLPSILTTAFSLHFFPSWMTASGLVIVVAWVAQTFIQLVLLSVIMVGQKIQSDTTITALSVQADNKHSEIKDLHETLSRDISKIHSYFSKPKDQSMSAIAEVKQLIETALASVEDEIDNEVVQVVKSKLVDLQSFLSTVVDDAGEQLDPVAPADPNASLNPPAAPVGPVAPSEPATPEAPVDPTTAPEVPTPPTDEVTPPADGSDPVTNEAGEQVTDPNAPR